MENKIHALKPILARKQLQVIAKRLKNQHLTQVESNYLSQDIRPKLIAAEIASQMNLLKLVEYKRKLYEKDENILKNKILTAAKNISQNIKSIILYGSYIQNNKTNYKDIDIMLIVKKKFWKNTFERNKVKKLIESRLDIPADILLISQKSLHTLLPYDPFLQTAVETHKVIYGSIKLNKKRIINQPYLFGLLLNSEFAIELKRIIEQKNIYNAIRNCLSIELFLNKVVSNFILKEMIINNIGIEASESLKNNASSESQKKEALKYLNYLYHRLERELR